MNVFAPHLKRSEILNHAKNINFTDTRSITLRIHRNHAFEPIASIIAPFLHHANLQAKFCYGNYDDSLSFADFDRSLHVDAEVIFLDLHRYKLSQSDLKDFLQQRCAELRALSDAPILLLLLESTQGLFDHLALHMQDQDIFAFSLNALYSEHCEISGISKPLLDEIKESITGTKLSNTATLLLAQILGLKYLPSLFFPSLKAIVLDLDQTLYQGVLGEDGWEALELSREHEVLQQHILKLKSQGYLLAIASKNDERDAQMMFHSRKDFPLQWEDFDHVKINWESKATNLAEIAKFFNIGIDSMLFIDDNLAEIESTKPTGIQQIHATTPQDTLLALHLYPRLYKFQTHKEDAIRSQDISANVARQALQTLSDEEYFSNLAISLTFRIDAKEDAPRVHELMNKTNQFIANYTRPNLSQVQAWIEDPCFCLISITMQDRLSDSGIIGIIVAQNAQNNLHIIDIAVSCRALGRRLETPMLLYSFKLAQESLALDSHQAFIHFQQGERNLPFLQCITPMQTESNIIPIPQSNPMPKGISLKKHHHKGQP